MLEFALCLPLIVLVIYGLWALAGIMRARYQMILISHAVMREAAGGIKGRYTLTRLAEGYARGMDAQYLDCIRVEVSDAGLPASLGLFPQIMSVLARGSRVEVSAVVKVSGPMARVWPRGIPMQCSSVLLIDAWRHPVGKIGKVVATALGFASGEKL